MQKKSRIKWKSTKGWDIYYATNGTSHGETTSILRAAKVTEKRFLDLKEKKLIPESAEFEN